MIKKHANIGYDLVMSLVAEGSRVLDLGCGDGTLLSDLQKTKGVKGAGVEISEEGVSKCVEKGLYCYQGDIDEGLSDYRDKSFDFVILNQTIQNTKKPQYVLREIIRIGGKIIVSFPNFGYILLRMELLWKGMMPVNPLFPYEWYESPDIHKLSINNFNDFCLKNSYEICDTFHFTISSGGRSKIIKFFPNLFAQYGFYVLEGK